MNLPPLKPYQQRGIDAMQKARRLKVGPVLGVAPPGAGKSRCMYEIAKAEIEDGGRVLIFAHRKMLIAQLIKVFREAGIEYGVISPDHASDPDAPLQIVSTPTLFRRAVVQSKMELPKATLVMKDEAHQQCGVMSRAIVFGSYANGFVQEGYMQQGVDVIGFTATPMMKARMYSRLIDFGSYSELRREGMHQLIHVHSPDEIDVQGLTTNADGEYSEKGLEKRVQVIYGSVFEEWRRLNPQRLPAILFAPSVASSRWFAHQFHDAGVGVAHIDGESCLISEGGKLQVYASTPDIRQRILDGSKSGEFSIVCNRFVLREAIDMPWLFHGIFATVMGSLTTYLQSVGRLQRFWPEYNNKILQCHGGSYWRHGSPNMDRNWRLGLTNKIAQKERVDRILSGKEPEGKRCPKCGLWRKGGAVCPNTECNHSSVLSVRSIRTKSGKLKQMRGRVYVKPLEEKSIAEKAWSQSLWIAASKGLTMGQAVAMYWKRAEANGFSDSPYTMRNPPPQREDPKWDLKVTDVYPHMQRKAKA